MKKGTRRSASGLPMGFEIDPEPAEGTWTARAGVGMLVETYRRLGVPEMVKRWVRLKQRERGYDEAAMVESFVVLNAAGGDCLDDFEHLREDRGLTELVGHEFPSPSAARKFLYGFHDEGKLDEARALLAADERAIIPGESLALQGLGEVNRELVEMVGRRLKEEAATIDQDATIIESRKEEATKTYEGVRGYQPMLAVWAETGLIVADEFRDGNVPALMRPVTVARRAVEALPGSVKRVYFRGDSACHNVELIDWLRDEQREGGRPGFIGFAISARMSDELQKAVEKIEEEKWEVLERSDEKVVREWAEVVFVSNQEAKNRESEPLRYVAIRVQPRQGELFADGSRVKHYAIVSNIWDWTGAELIKWQRQKAGTIEHVHHNVKNELAGGVLPCGKFGANAAWFRLVAISHNVMTAMQRLTLPPELHRVRPKRLRFLVLNVAGQLIHHARRIVLRLVRTRERIAEFWLLARALLAAPIS